LIGSPDEPDFERMIPLATERGELFVEVFLIMRDTMKDIVDLVPLRIRENLVRKDVHGVYKGPKRAL
jgi:hypothetical protein